MENMFKLKLTLKELFFVASCLQDRQRSITNDIIQCRKFELNSTPSEDSLAIVTSALIKTQKKLEEALYE